MNLEILKTIWQKICQLPKWARVVVITLIAGLVIVLGLTSCGPTVKVTAKSTTDMVTISVSQDVRDSTGVSVNVNPNITVNPL